MQAKRSHKIYTPRRRRRERKKYSKEAADYIKGEEGRGKEYTHRIHK